MASIPNPSEEQFSQAANDWDLERLYEDLASAKRQVAGHKRRGLTEVEKLNLRGLLCGYSPAEIAAKLVKNARGLDTTLSQTLYRYVEELTNRPANSVKNWRDIREWLEAAGYKIPSSDSVEREGAIAPPREDEEELAIGLEGTASKNPDFVGREGEIAELITFVALREKVIVIYGKGGVGKTTLARQYLKYLKAQGFKILELWMAKETHNITSVESVVEELLQDLKGEPGREFGITLKRLRQQLQNQKFCMFIDNLEPALDKDGKFIQKHRGYIELLSVLADSDVQSITLITSRERLNESCVSVKPYELKGLDEEAWQQFFSSRDIVTDSPALNEIHKVYGGNAIAMKVLCYPIQTYYGSNLEAYWQDNKEDLLKAELKDLIASQFNRLKEHDINAYKLLCRLGAYRYQHIPKLPIKGLRDLLWDVPKLEHIQIIDSLQRPALVEFSKGEYWLHPVIKAEAVERLKLEGEWELTNSKAANFWKFSALEILNNKKIVIEAVNLNSNEPDILSLLIDAAQPFESSDDSQWRVRAWESVYHLLESCSFESLEEFKEQESKEKDIATHLFIKDASELVENMKNLGLSFHKLGEYTYKLAIIDKQIGDIPKSLEEFNYSEICFNKAWTYFRDSISIANQFKAYSIAKEAKKALAETYYWRGIGLHKSALNLIKNINLKESQEVLKESRRKFEEAFTIFREIKANKQAEEVEQAMNSLKVSENCCTISIAISFLCRRSPFSQHLLYGCFSDRRLSHLGCFVSPLHLAHSPAFAL